MRFKSTKYLYLIFTVLLFTFLTSTEYTSALRRTVATDIVISGNYAYVHVMNDGLQIIDISNPNDPQFVSHLKLPYHYSHKMYKENNYLYFSAHNPSTDLNEIHIVDVSNPQSPVQIGNYKQSGIDIHTFYLSNNLLFIPLDKLEIIDVSNPQSPSKIGEYIIDTVYGISFSNDMAYILTESDGMHILNISSPESPSLFKKYSNINGFYISMEDDYAIISNWSIVSIYDKSNSSDIIFLDSIAADNLVDHYVSDDRIYYHSYSSRIGTIDFSNPNSLSAFDVYYTGGDINEMCVDGNYIYIAADESGMLILDMSNPSSPINISYYEIYLPFIFTRNIILISVSAAIVVGIIAIPIWQRDKIKKRIELNKIKRDTGPPPRIHRAIRISIIASVAFFVASLSIIIGVASWNAWIGIFLGLFLGSFSIAALCLGPLITWTVVRARKKSVVQPIEATTQPIVEEKRERQEGMIFCPSCGKQISAEQKHCSKCGYKM